VIPKIQKISYAADFSTNCVYALRYAISSAINRHADQPVLIIPFDLTTHKITVLLHRIVTLCL